MKDSSFGIAVVAVWQRVCLRRDGGKRRAAANFARSSPPTRSGRRPLEPGLLVFTPARKCTFVMRRRTRRPTPRAGRRRRRTEVGKIDLIATAPGHFKCRSPKSSACEQRSRRGRGSTTRGHRGSPPYEIEHFKVNIPIKKGQSLAAKATQISFVRCKFGSENTLVYHPRLRSTRHSKWPVRNNCLCSSSLLQ